MSRYFIASTVFWLLVIGGLALQGVIHVNAVFYSAVTAVYVLSLVVGSIYLSLEFYYPVLYRNPASNCIAITFDDGPEPGSTDKVLDVLNHYNVKAAFFCIGHKVAEHAELVQRIDGEGHLLGNHSFWHKTTFNFLSAPMVTNELVLTENELKKVTGRSRFRLFRPPFGVSNPMVAKAVKRLNYTVIGWSVRSFDTVIHDPDRLYKRVIKKLKGGDIILFHDHSKSMLQVLPKVIEHARKSGLNIVRVDELLNIKY